MLPSVLPSVQVIVIGAGLAGLACAWELRSHGVQVLVLEGKHDVGGRVYTDTDGIDKGPESPPHPRTDSSQIDNAALEMILVPSAVRALMHILTFSWRATDDAHTIDRWALDSWGCCINRLWGGVMVMVILIAMPLD